MITFGIVGLLLISRAVWLKDEKWQNILFITGGVSLLVYSINLGDKIFIILQLVFITSALAELLKLKTWPKR